MPYPFQEIRAEIKQAMRAVEEAIYEKIQPLAMTAWRTAEPVPFRERCSGEEIRLSPGDSWGGLWDCAWFRFQGVVPPEADGRKTVLLIDISGEACLFDETGCPVQGLTNVSSEFDLSLGKPGKRVVPVAEQGVAGTAIDLWADAGCNDLFGKYQDSGRVVEAHVAVCRESLRKLHYDFEVLSDLLTQLDPQSARAASILHNLNRAMLVLSGPTEAEAAAASAILAPELAKRNGDVSLSVSAIGHAHIDLAWLWPIRETRRKGARTFSTALRMMERYPDYIFGASQPQLYDWVRQDYPALYSQIRERIAEGRWEPQGAMWVEADTNVSGGEALIRQILYGKRYYMKEFGKEMRSLWLPDVFGYSGALPQLLKKSGVDYFMTIKLSWNTYNKFPHHSFLWAGIDGSEVLAHMPPEGTYNSAALPSSVIRAEQSFMDKGMSDTCLMLFGIGDGGGGPGEEHLERLERTRNLQGMAPVKQEPSDAFFSRLATGAGALKRWQGELYLEKHQGTYTSQARNKRFNRKLEIALRELEFTASVAALLGKAAYPAESLELLWKEVLLFQFHDILPGSSIGRVYDESVARYQAIAAETAAMEEAMLQALSPDTPLLVNSLSWPRQAWMKMNGDWYQADVPALGIKPWRAAAAPVAGFPVSATTTVLENEILRVEIRDDGSIGSVWDKVSGREVMAPQASGNRLTVYHDAGDGWDFSIQYRQRPAGDFRLVSAVAETDGPRAMVHQVYTFGASRLSQTVVLTAGSRRIDFVTRADWQERKKMLRTSFPLQLRAPEVTCDIQFGTVRRPTHRNTGFDMAMEEICAHQWVDLSQPDYGVALMNDCKYGYHAEAGTLDLNLLRSPEYPDAGADLGNHEFTYSLYPHTGDAILGAVDRAAWELNLPLKIHVPQEPAGQAALQTLSLAEADSDHVVTEAVKQAEDGPELILRMYECHGTSVVTRVCFGRSPQRVFLTDMLERNIEELPVADGTVALHFGPFEIHTLKLVY